MKAPGAPVPSGFGRKGPVPRPIAIARVRGSLFCLAGVHQRPCQGQYGRAREIPQATRETAPWRWRSNAMGPPVLGNQPSPRARFWASGSRPGSQNALATLQTRLRALEGHCRSPAVAQFAPPAPRRAHRTHRALAGLSALGWGG